MTIAELEFYIIESVRDMLVYEEEDLLPVVLNPNDENLDYIIEKLIPYLELNMCHISVPLLEANLLQTMRDNARENLRNYKEMILSKISPARFKKLLQAGANKLINEPVEKLRKVIAAGALGAKKAVKREVAKRLEYASENLARAAEKLKK